MNSTAPAPLPVWTSFRFTGNSVEYFKIWIVNVLLTIITLGLYSPWAKVRTLAYFHGNTWLNDSCFAYLADPVKILKGRLIAVVLLAAYWYSVNFYPETSLAALAVLCLSIPFIMVTSMAFRMRNTAYRNIRFHFRADYAGAYRLFLIPIGVILAITTVFYSLFLASDLLNRMEAENAGIFRKEDMLFTFFLLAVLPVAPYIDYLRRKFIINHSQYGTALGSFTATGWKFYGIYLVAFLLAIGLAVVLAVIVVVIAAIAGIAGYAENPSPETTAETAFTIFFTMMIIFYGIGFFILGYLMAGITNATWNNTGFDTLRLQSHLRGGKIGWLLLSNTIAIIFSLGMLIPWSRIRMARYVAESTEFLPDRIESIYAMAQSDRSAAGEEIGDMFDLDLGL